MHFCIKPCIFVIKVVVTAYKRFVTLYNALFSFQEHDTHAA